MAAGGATSFLFHSFQVAEEDSTKGRLFRYAGILSHHAEIGPKLPDSTSNSSAITDKMHALHTPDNESGWLCVTVWSFKQCLSDNATLVFS